MLEQMEKYVQFVLPDGMPQRKREPLHDEFLCHLLDRYEFYREIGFDRLYLSQLGRLVHFPSVWNILFIVSHQKTSFVVK